MSIYLTQCLFNSFKRIPVSPSFTTSALTEVLRITVSNVGRTVRPTTVVPSMVTRGSGRFRSGKRYPSFSSESSYRISPWWMG